MLRLPLSYLFVCGILFNVVDTISAEDADGTEVAELLRQAKIYREPFNKKQNIDLALSSLSKAVEQYKSPDAMNALGELYLNGEGSIKPDFDKAMGYFNSSADEGFGEAQHNLALMYALGLKDKKSDEAMSVLYDYFASMDDSPLAKMALGYRHLYGYGVPKSCETAVLYYLPVAEQVLQRLNTEPFAPLIERTRLSDEAARNASPEEDDDMLQYYRQSAQGGNVNAQLALGQLYFYGAYGVQQNILAATQYFEAAAKGGDASAMSFLGRIHLKGLTNDSSNTTALQYFEQAADKGNSAGYNGVGYIYVHGCGVKKDIKTAIKYLKLSAEQNYATAQYNLGMLYFEGNGVEKQQSTALRYFSMAAHQGHTQALYYLGQIHINGIGTMRSCSIGVKLLKSVAERGPWASALTHAHSLYLKDQLIHSFMLYAHLAEIGYEVAQSNSAWLLEYAMGNKTEDVPQPQELALRHLTYCSDQGNTDSLRLIGDYSYYGTDFLEPNYKRAAKYYRMAADKLNAQSMFNLGYMHEYGIGIPQDFNLAKRYFDQCFTADAESFVPVSLALGTLWFHVVYEDLVAWFQGNTEEKRHFDNKKLVDPKYHKSMETPHTDSSSSSSSSGGSSSSSSSSSDDDGSGSWSRISNNIINVDNIWDMLMNEDGLLLILCAILAFLVYLRSLRQQ